MAKYVVSKNGEQELKEINRELMEDEIFTDVTLISDDFLPVRAHRSFLSRASSSFKTILMMQSGQIPSIFIRGSSKREIKSILEYIYLGETQVQEEDIASFLKLAKDFMIQDFIKLREITSGTGANTIEKSRKNKILEPETEQINDTNRSNDSFKQDKESRKESEDNYTVDDQDYCEYIDNGDYRKQEMDKAKTGPWNNDEVLKETGINCPKPLKLGHQKRKRRVKNKPNKSGYFDCAQCAKVFTKHQNMRTHYMVAHEGFVYQCNVCDYKNARKNQLSRHIETSHPEYHLIQGYGKMELLKKKKPVL